MGQVSKKQICVPTQNEKNLKAFLQHWTSKCKPHHLLSVTTVTIPPGSRMRCSCLKNPTWSRCGAWLLLFPPTFPPRCWGGSGWLIKRDLMESLRTRSAKIWFASLRKQHFFGSSKVYIDQILPSEDYKIRNVLKDHSSKRAVHPGMPATTKKQ